MNKVILVLLGWKSLEDDLHDENEDEVTFHEDGQGTHEHENYIEVCETY